MSPRPPSDRARSGFLAGGHAVTVTREEHHHEVLRRHAVGPTTAELGFCTIGSGRYRGRRAIEVRLAGARVGELTFRMSERYAGLVRSDTTCAATVDDGHRGRQVTLWLPPPEARTDDPVTARLPVVPALRVGIRHRVGFTGSQTAVLSTAAPSPPPAPLGSPVERPNGTSSLVVPGQRGPARVRRPRRPLLVVGGSVAALLTTVVVVAQSGGGRGDAGPTATSTSISRTATPTTTPAPAVVTTLRAPAPSTAVAPRTTTTTAETAACHPSYRPCLPVRTDLDCADIRQKVKVVGPDSYRLDRDGDGWACESYG